jgi:hypothetical protein
MSAAAQFKEVVFGPVVMLPPQSTDQPEQPASHHDFVHQILLVSPGLMHEEKNLPVLFTWEDLYKVFQKRILAKAWVEFLLPLAASQRPAPTGDFRVDAAALEAFVLMERRRQEEHLARSKEIKAQFDAAAEGEKYYVPLDDFEPARLAAKAYLDELTTRDQFGNTKMNFEYARAFLKFYWAFAKSKTVNEGDVPR